MEHVALRDFLAKLLSVVALFALVHRDSDYLLAAAVQSGGMALAGLVGLISVPFLLPVRFRTPTRMEVWEALRSGWPIFLSMAATTLGTITNIFILGLRASPAEVAYFTAAQRIIGALRALVSPLVTAVYPYVSSKAARSEEEAVRFLRKYSLLFSVPFFLVGLALLISAPLAVRIVLGVKYIPSVVLLQVMAFSPFMLAMSHMYSTNFMLSCGYDKEWLRIILMSTFANFVLLVPLLWLIRGSMAIAITTTVTDVFSLALYWRFYHRHASRYV
jgi:O-antigen/teichoic acid export membrane protein